MNKLSLLIFLFCLKLLFSVLIFMYYEEGRQVIASLKSFIFNPRVDKPLPSWRWKCENEQCVKVRNDDSKLHTILSLDVCKLACGEYGMLWPRPTGKVVLGNIISKIDLHSLQVKTKYGASTVLLKEAVKRFKEKLVLYAPQGDSLKIKEKTLVVFINIQNPNLEEFHLYMNENYTLRVTGFANSQIVRAQITAITFFGARHGLETLLQLITYDEISDRLVIAHDAEIDDVPSYTYRGLLLDTARNYYDVVSIKRTIDAMAAVKLNTFHWHIIDSQSFPFVSERRPNLSKLGAYGPNKVYTKNIIKTIVEYGRVRGVRVIPEFDAPAHAGEGWQGTNLTVCFEENSWQTYCTEPPCGQLDPTKDKLYDYLEDIYTDMAEAFNPDIFHMGGDEVSETCWNVSQEITTFMEKKKMSYLRLWVYFQKKAQKRAYKAFGRKLPLILWSSVLTEYPYFDKHINKDEYIIQTWTKSIDNNTRTLLEKGYSLIISHYDVMYLDCGVEKFLYPGNNWCSPHIGWQTIYNYELARIAENYTDQILGGEAAMWSELTDPTSLDNRVWPRAAALAELLWTAPYSSWEHALDRIIGMRDRLVRMGIQAYPIQPAWCKQNDGKCSKILDVDI